MGVKAPEKSRGDVAREAARRVSEPAVPDRALRGARADMTAAWKPKQIFRPPHAPFEMGKAETREIARNLGLEPLKREIQRMSDAELLAAIRETEAKLGAPITPTAAAELAGTPVGATHLIPINFIREGQVEFSLTNVRAKALDFVEAIHAALAQMPKDHLGAPPPSLLGYEEALTGAVQPGGKGDVLTDGHHHLAGLKVVRAVIERHLTSWRNSDAPTANWKANREIEAVSHLLGGATGVPSIPIKVVKNYSQLTEPQFWSVMRGDMGNKPLVYLTDVDGHTVKVPPKQFGDMKDNPYRWLASQTTGKISLTGKGKDTSIELKGGEYPVWLKTLNRAPPFIEFTIARIYKQAFDQLGLPYDPNVPLTDEARLVCRWALLQVKRDPNHWAHDIIADVPVLIKDVRRKRMEHHLSPDEASATGVHVPHRFLRPGKRRVRSLREAIDEIRAEQAQ